MKLSELPINTCAFILHLRNPNKISRIRLLEMGFVPGTLFKITKVAPFCDPIGISIRGYELCIGLKDATYIDVMKVSSIV